MSGIDLSTLNEAQRRIATTLDDPLFVQAGAGSGKTFTLTRRVVWALSEGSGANGRPFLDDLSQVLVITFTNAAAREIKERVRSSLRDAGMHELSLSVDSAWISTIHGMCQRILRRNALQLGLDPGFGVCDTHLQEQMIDEAVDRAVGAARRNAKRDSVVWRMFEDLEYFGVVTRVRTLVNLAHAASEGFDSLLVAEAGAAGGIAAAMSDLARSYEALGSVKGLSAAAQKAVVPSLEALREFEALPPSHRTPKRALEALAVCKMPRSSKAIADFHAEAKAELEHAKAMAALEDAAELAPVLVDLALRTDECYTQLKRSQALLDNDDLITLALDAVRNDPVVEARYAGRFRLVMVDEFQDTDAKQLELISLLAGGGACRSGLGCSSGAPRSLSLARFASRASATRADAPVGPSHEEGRHIARAAAALQDDSGGGQVPRHLATVGDAQQSIYRFRGADVSVFNAHGTHVPEAGHVRLDMNYRSHADVLAFVDAVCGGQAGVLEDFMHLDACPTRKDGYRARSMPRVTVELVTSQEKGVNAQDRTVQLASQLADRLAQYSDAGEPAGGMALLLGSTTHADCYIDALRARGLECVVTGGSTFTKAPEVGVMLALLRTLANPRDTQSGLFPLLSSEMFELDANDFVQLGSRRQQKLDAPTKRTIDKGLAEFEFFGDASPSARLEHAHEVLSRALEDVSTKPVADVCMDVVMGSGWLSRLEEQGPQGIAREANVLAAIRYIRDLTSELGLGPVRAAAEFAHWLEVSKVPPASLAGAEQNTVRVMTIHASKGLEYPVVAVAECWSNPKQDGGLWSGKNAEGQVEAVLAPKGGVKLDGAEDACRTGDIVDTACRLRNDARAADAQEKARLLYVALTRAREALVLAMNVPTSKQGISSELAAGVVDALMGGELPPEGECSLEYGGSAPACVRHVVATHAEPEEPDDGETARVVGLYPVEVISCDEVSLVRAREDVFSYSSALAGLSHGAEVAAPVAGSARRPPAPRKEEREAEAAGEPVTSDEDKATNLGSAFHMVAQAMVESAGKLPAERVDAICLCWGLSPRQRARLDTALVTWRASELRKEALGWNLVRAEVPFFALSGGSPHGRYVEGAIDLLCTNGTACEGAALVVDYKTGDLKLTEEQVRARHAAQAELYANVLLSLGFDSVECAFFAVETGVVVRYKFECD